MPFIKILYALFSFMVFFPAKAAIIEGLGPPYNSIFVHGELLPDDDVRFLEISTQLQKATVYFSSPGGNLLAGINIGSIIRLRNFDTAVVSNNLCASACAFAWLAGANKFMGNTAHIGFHASYIIANNNKNITGPGNAILGKYMADLGLSYRAIVFTTTAGPNNLNYLTPEKARELDINVIIGHPNDNNNLDNYEKTSSLIIVKLFYEAIINLDFITAISYITPEKQNQGAFTPEGMFKFYSSLDQPLFIKSITEINKEDIEVLYSYKTRSSVCNAKAIVKTKNHNGKKYIQSINANC